MVQFHPSSFFFNKENALDMPKTDRPQMPGPMVYRQMRTANEAVFDAISQQAQRETLETKCRRKASACRTQAKNLLDKADLLERLANMASQFPPDVEHLLWDEIPY